MFKRIKVITLLISVLLVLGIMQLISAGIFINALNNDKENFTVSQLSSQNVAEFTDAWISLNQARVTLNRGMLRLQSSMASQINGGQLNELVNTAKNLLADAQTHYDKYYALPETPGMDEHLADRLEEQYRVYSATLTQMNVLLGQGNLEDMFKQNAEQKQTAMQKVYREWREAQAALEGQPIPPLPPLRERWDTAVRQIRLAVEDKGEHIALLEARKQLCWYLKGVSHANYYKEQIVRLTTLEELYRVAEGVKRDLT